MILPSSLYTVQNSEFNMLQPMYHIPDTEILNDYSIYLELVFNGLYTVQSE